MRFVPSVVAPILSGSIELNELFNKNHGVYQIGEE